MRQNHTVGYGHA